LEQFQRGVAQIGIEGHNLLGVADGMAEALEEQSPIGPAGGAVEQVIQELLHFIEHQEQALQGFDR
jgi:hypothetical protein